MHTKTVMITGANRGIGLQFTRVFSAQGWRVIACCRQPDRSPELAALGEQHDNLGVHALDVTDYERVAALASELQDQPIDLLLSNAGVYGARAGFGTVDVALWRREFEVNTIAPLKLVEHFVDHVAASQKKLIAMISSKMGSIADNSSGNSYAYRSSKTALNSVSKSLSIDLADRGISVVILHPGWVRTDMGGSNALKTVEESVDGMMKTLETAEQRSGEFIDLDGRVIPW